MATKAWSNFSKKLDHSFVAISRERSISSCSFQGGSRNLESCKWRWMVSSTLRRSKWPRRSDPISDLEDCRWRWKVPSTFGRWKWPRRSGPISPRSGFWHSCSYTLTKCWGVLVYWKWLLQIVQDVVKKGRTIKELSIEECKLSWW